MDRTPQGPLHADVVEKLADRLVRSLSRDVRVRSHSPLALSEESEPEPDIALVAAGDYSSAHPRHALLVIEVADTSLQKDRTIKTALYAGAGIPEFWLANQLTSDRRLAHPGETIHHDQHAFMAPARQATA